VKQVFEWIALDRCSLGEVCRRLQKAGEGTQSGKSIWSRQAVWHILQNPAYYGKAAFGKTRMKPRAKSVRLRPPRGRLVNPRKPHVAVAVDQKDLLFIPVPPLIKPALFQGAQRQLNENRTRARRGTRRPGHLLQGLLVCSECRYAYYGKTTRQRGAGGLKDFIYYRCSGTDGYRFGGERICNNPQIRGEFIETCVWAEVCELLKNPQRLQQEREQRLEIARSPANLDALKSQLGKLQRGMEKLIDSYLEGAIDKEQFISRLSRTKDRIADLEARIHTNTEGADHRQELRFLVDHFRKLADSLGRCLEDADWNRRREIIRGLIERIEIGRQGLAIIFRRPIVQRRIPSF
jgi:site-specific DNA recombinase